MLRAADKSSGTVQIHTDLTSTKVAELTANPMAALHVWERKLHLQTRLRGEMTVQTGDSVAHLWSQVPDGSRSSYGVTPAPGTAIPASDAYDRAPNHAQFAVLTLTIAEIDAVHLSGDYHRHALFARTDDWTGTWLAP